MIGLHLAFFINIISYFMIFRYFSIHWPSKKTVFPILVSIYSASKYLSDQPPFVENTVNLSVTFYSCDCELLADNYEAFK